MISVIIPTMWRAPHIIKLLPMLNSNPYVGEIILIDNDRSKTNHNLLKNINKLVYWSFQEGNVFVNPAWNLGVKISKYDKLCIMNDDCLINLNDFKKIYDKITPDIGILGFSQNSYCQYIVESFDCLCDAGFGSNITFDVINPSQHKLYRNGMPHIYYGSVMFMHKHNYRVIPQEFKVYFGDLFLYVNNLKNGRGNYVIENGLVLTKGSSTASLLSPEIFNNEKNILAKIFQEHDILKINYNIKKIL